MPEQNLEQKVLDAIETESISPKPQWQLSLAHYLWLLAGVVFTLIGALAFAVLMHMIRTNDWDVYEYINENFWAYLFGTLPYVWIGLLILLMGLGYVYVRKTGCGYRYSFWLVTGAVVVTSAGLGTLGYYVGLGEALDTVFAEHIPQYNHVVNRKQHLWQQPDAGRLGGMVVHVENPQLFLLKDFERHPWQVIVVSPVSVEPNVVFVGNRVRLLGEQVGEWTFEAERILPFQPPKRQKHMFFQMDIQVQQPQLQPQP